MTRHRQENRVERRPRGRCRVIHRLATASLNIDYTGTAKVGDWITVEMDPLRVGRRLAFANAGLMTAGKQVARPSAVFAGAVG